MQVDVLNRSMRSGVQVRCPTAASRLAVLYRVVCLGFAGAKREWPRTRHDSSAFQVSESWRWLKAGSQYTPGHLALVEYRGDWAECNLQPVARNVLIGSFRDPVIWSFQCMCSSGSQQVRARPETVARSSPALVKNNFENQCDLLPSVSGNWLVQTDRRWHRGQCPPLSTHPPNQAGLNIAVNYCGLHRRRFGHQVRKCFGLQRLGEPPSVPVLQRDQREPPRLRCLF
jgi:hypothetical protein